MRQSVSIEDYCLGRFLIRSTRTTSLHSLLHMICSCTPCCPLCSELACRMTQSSELKHELACRRFCEVASSALIFAYHTWRCGSSALDMAKYQSLPVQVVGIRCRWHCQKLPVSTWHPNAQARCDLSVAPQSSLPAYVHGPASRRCAVCTVHA